MNHRLQTLRVAWRLAILGLVNRRSFTITTALNIALGVLGFLVVQAFNFGFLREISQRTQSIAGGDLIATTRNEPSAEIMKKLNEGIPKPLAISEEQSLLTMVAANGQSRLIEVRFVDQNYPLYGDITFENSKNEEGRAQEKNTSLGRQLKGTFDVWAYPELKQQLGISIGSLVKIGNLEFRIKDFILEDPSTSGMGFTIAPRIYVSKEHSIATGLILPGSRVQYAWRYKLDPNVDTVKLEEQLKTKISDQDLRIRSHKNASEEMTRMQAYLNDYLGLVALSALFLASIGTSYLLRGHLTQSIKEFGILISLGAKPRTPVYVFAIQSIIVGLIGAGLAAILSILLLPIMQMVMQPITGKTGATISFSIAGIPWIPIGLGCVIAIFSGLLTALPLLVRLSNLKPNFLFQEASAPKLIFDLSTGLWYLPGLIVWWLAAIWQSQSLKNGSLFAALFLSSAIFLYVFGLGLLKLLGKYVQNLKVNWTFKLAFIQLSRNPVATMSAFLALALGATLINVIPQVRRSVTAEIERPDSTVPRFFMFDIQDEQIEPLKTYFKDKNIAYSNPSPMIRARLEAIDGVAAIDRKINLEDNREQERRENLQTRMQNLSFRFPLSSSETIVEGTYELAPWDGTSIPAISVEQDFADRLGLKMGSLMTFEISGVKLEAKITSIRKVRWTSFQPNFFILFQAGVLDDAPKIWVTSASGLDDSNVPVIQSDIVKIWPNISVVDVKATISRLLLLIDQITTAMSFVAILTILAGIGVLFAVATHEAQKRRTSFALLKTLGANHTKTIQSTLSEFVCICVVAIVFGTILSGGLSLILSKFIFKAAWKLDLTTPLVTACVLIPLTLSMTWIAIRRALNEKVNSLL